jgi:hypothetical protein
MAKSLPPLAKLREWLRYDAQTGDFFWIQCPGKKMQPGKKAGSKRGPGYIRIEFRDRQMQAHRLAWLFHYGEDPGKKQIDHINGDPSDNRIENLRVASSWENCLNKKKSPGFTSEYKGVSWFKEKQRWRAQIHVKGKTRFLGYFHDEMAAHMAYCQAAHDTFGEFARFE